MLDRPDTAEPTVPLARSDRARTGSPADRGDPGALTGAAVLAILRRRKMPLLVSILLAPLLGFIAISQVTPLYTATGTLIYNPPEYNVREMQSILRVDPITDAVMPTQAEVLRGLPVVERVADRLNLHSNPEFNRTLRPISWPERALGVVQRLFDLTAPATRPAQPDAAIPSGPVLDPGRNATLHAVQNAFTVSPLKTARVLEVSFTAQSPVLAAAAVNIAMDAYIKDQLGVKFRAVHRANDWLENRVKELRAEVQTSEDRIAAYRAKEGLVEGVRARLDTEQISHLTEGMASARNDLAVAEARLDAASGRAGATAQAAVAPSVVQLRAQQSQLTAQLQSLLARLGPNHPEVQGLRNQYVESERMIAAEIARVVAATAADVRADRERIATLEQNLRTVQAHVEHDTLAQIPLNAMQRDAEASRTLLQSVLERIQQIAQQAAIEAPDAHEISVALPPGRPTWPRTGPLMGAASAFGLLFGMLLVYLLELVDDTFRSGADIRSVLDLPCLALIPRVGRRALGSIKIDEYAARKPLSPLAEQFRSLRAGLWLKPNRPRIIAITAARPAEGKTTVTLALGRLAAMNGERVVVLDCDLRRPSFDRRLQTEAEPGLVDCLQERATLAEVIHKDPLSGMDTIPAGKAGSDASGLVMSATMARLLQTLRQDYDLVLLDAPPAQAVTDARVVAAIADATLLCVRWRSTPRKTVLLARELLEEAHANVVGAILTQVEVRVHVRSGYADAEVYHPRYGGYFRE